MSEPQHPTPFGDHAGNRSHAAHDAAASRAREAMPMDSIAAVGARLAQLRESKMWSLDDVSARLKVPPQKLRALEAGDLSHLPDRTFAAGIIRSYAKILGADPEPFTQALRRANGPIEQNLSLPGSGSAVRTSMPRTRVSVPLGNSNSRKRSWLWGIAAIIVAVLALGMWHTGGDSAAWFARLKATANGTSGAGDSATTAASAVATPDEAAAANTGEPSTAPDTTTGGQPMPRPLGTNALPASSSTIAEVQGASAVAVPPALASVPAAAPAAAAAAASSSMVTGEGANAVELKVKQDSWFSVRQKDGKEVFSGLVHAGSTQRVQGEGPFKVTVGNVAGLESLTLDDEPVDVKKYSGARGNVARFSLP
jgi:cytoskeleton protein RodZ